MQITLTDIVLHMTKLKQFIWGEWGGGMWLHCTYYDMSKVVCYIETKKLVKNVANTIVIAYAVLTKLYYKSPCKLTTL